MMTSNAIQAQYIVCLDAVGLGGSYFFFFFFHFPFSAYSYSICFLFFNRIL